MFNIINSGYLFTFKSTCKNQYLSYFDRICLKIKKLFIFQGT